MEIFLVLKISRAGYILHRYFLVTVLVLRELVKRTVVHVSKVLICTCFHMFYKTTFQRTQNSGHEDIVKELFKQGNSRYQYSVTLQISVQLY